MSRRLEKIADQLQHEVAELLHRDVKHPVLAEAMVSITRVEVAPDLAHARLHVSVLEPGGEALPGLPVIEG
ncbi:MAG: ribosome-binding factor A, partial [Dehalococcoidia bacterium]|nr:ribosome-binding factor A [Dehalococcoidia bacterium]